MLSAGSSTKLRHLGRAILPPRHRNRHAGRRWIAKRQSRHDPRRQEAEALRFQRVAVPADRFDRLDRSTPATGANPPSAPDCAAPRRRPASASAARGTRPRAIEATVNAASVAAPSAADRSDSPLSASARPKSSRSSDFGPGNREIRMAQQPPQHILVHPPGPSQRAVRIERPGRCAGTPSHPAGHSRARYRTPATTRPARSR